MASFVHDESPLSANDNHPHSANNLFSSSIFIPVEGATPSPPHNSLSTESMDEYYLHNDLPSILLPNTPACNALSWDPSAKKPKADTMVLRGHPKNSRHRRLAEKAQQDTVKHSKIDGMVLRGHPKNSRHRRIAEKRSQEIQTVRYLSEKLESAFGNRRPSSALLNKFLAACMNSGEPEATADKVITGFQEAKALWGLMQEEEGYLGDDESNGPRRQYRLRKVKRRLMIKPRLVAGKVAKY